MKYTFIILLWVVFPVSVFSMESKMDSLLKIMDKVVLERSKYTEIRESNIFTSLIRSTWN